MQAMKRKQGAKQFVFCEGIDQGDARYFRCRSYFEQAVQPFAVHIKERLDKFLSSGARMWIRKRGNLLYQCLNTCRRVVVLLHFLWHYAISSIAGAKELKCAPQTFRRVIPKCTSQPVGSGDALCCCVALFPRVPSLSCWGDASVPGPTEGSAIPSWPQAAKRAWGRE